MWAVFDYHGTNHVVPLEDSGHHFTSAECHCCPVYDSGIYIHKSFDGREILEEMECEGSA